MRGRQDRDGDRGSAGSRGSSSRRDGGSYSDRPAQGRSGRGRPDGSGQRDRNAQDDSRGARDGSAAVYGERAGLRRDPRSTADRGGYGDRGGQRGATRGRQDGDGYRASARGRQDGVGYRGSDRGSARGRQDGDGYRGSARGRQDRDGNRDDRARRDEDRPGARLPSVPASITADQLDPAARAELRTLPSDLAGSVARYLVAAAQADDAERGYEYALAARKLAARVGIVRETCGIAAYRAGKWAEALAELRAARRLTGQGSYLPLMADSERALGRLDRALDLVTGPEANGLSRDIQVELRIVESGIRRDQGFPEAAVVALQIPELTDGHHRPGSARLYYAYADALTDAGREDEARYWFGRAATADKAGETDAVERIDDMDMLALDDLEADDLYADEDDADEDEANEDEGDDQAAAGRHDLAPGDDDLAAARDDAS